MGLLVEQFTHLLLVELFTQEPLLVEQFTHLLLVELFTQEPLLT